jgi:ferredoxin-nitrite reductase
MGVHFGVAVNFLRPRRSGAGLNEIERWKLERHPFEVAGAVRGLYARRGPEAIAAVPGETERLKWVGLYPQVQGGDAFMLRVKVPGGRLAAAQACRIGEVVEEFARAPVDHPVWGNRFCDITTRQDVQLHWVRIGDVPRIWDLLEEVGITTVQACGDSARNVVGCPVAGVDAEEVLDATPIAREISAFFTGNREYANLPRKFKISVTGCREDCARTEINDVGMWPARLGDGTVGFNLLVGGGLSDGPRMASDIDVFVPPEHAVEVTRAIAQVFGELGNRENRGAARMRYLVQELGPEGFRAELAKRAAFDLRPAGVELTRRSRGDHVGVHPQRLRGFSYVGLSVTVGRLTGLDLVEAGRLAELYGDGEVRLATDQNLVLTGVPDDRIEDLLEEDLLDRHSPSPAPFERGVMACTGSDFCRYALVETKARAAQWAREMDRRFAAQIVELPGARGRSDSGVVRMHFSGCSASCAQPQIADIGFRGETAHAGDKIVEAVDIGLGGSLGPDSAFGDWVEGAVPVDDVMGALGRLMDRYFEERRPEEPIYEWVRRSERSELRSTLRGGGPDEVAGGGSHLSQDQPGP